MSNPYLEAANPGQRAWWRYALTLCVLLVTWLVVQIPVSVLTIATGAVDLTTGALVTPLPAWAFVALLAIFPALGGALLLCVRWVHRRAPGTLLGKGGGIRWRPLVASALAVFGALAFGSLLQWLLAPTSLRFAFEPRAFLRMLPFVLVLVPLQATTEELFYRGWLMQGLGRGGRWVWPAAIVSSALFALSHLGAGYIDGGLGALDLLVYFAIGALLSWVTLRDGRLERAIGLHVGLNLFGFTLVGPEHPMVVLPTVFTDPLVTNDPINLVAVGALGLAIWASARWVEAGQEAARSGAGRLMSSAR